MSDTRKAAWHTLPEPVKQQAAARWASGVRAAGPGDGYIYTFAMLDEPGHQLDLFTISSAYGLAPRVPRLIGRRLEKRPQVLAPMGLNRCSFGL
jgi:hypothetical protein